MCERNSAVGVLAMAIGVARTIVEFDVSPRSSLYDEKAGADGVQRRRVA